MDKRLQEQISTYKKNQQLFNEAKQTLNSYKEKALVKLYDHFIPILEDAYGIKDILNENIGCKSLINDDYCYHIRLTENNTRISFDLLKAQDKPYMTQQGNTFYPIFRASIPIYEDKHQETIQPTDVTVEVFNIRDFDYATAIQCFDKASDDYAIQMADKLANVNTRLVAQTRLNESLIQREDNDYYKFMSTDRESQLEQQFDR